MRQLRYVQVHLALDQHGNPVSGYILEEDADCQLHWLADTEFGPFDGYVDVCRWLSGALRGTFTIRPV